MRKVKVTSSTHVKISRNERSLVFNIMATMIFWRIVATSSLQIWRVGAFYPGAPGRWM